MSTVITSFQDVDQFLSTLPARTRSFEDRLLYIKSCLSSLSDPQDSAPSIHIAGTSGKGSTAYYASALLIEAGYSVGLIVSPHVSSVAERSQINGRPLTESEYCEYFVEFLSIVSENAFEFTYIEFLTVFAYWLFARVRVDYIVVEVGLGGRLDPTNVISRSDKVCIITSIGFDHVELLGDTLGKIASEKAGIITRDNEVLSYNQDAEIMDVIRAAVNTKDASLVIVSSPPLSKSVQLPIYQQFNYHLALQAVERRLIIDNKAQLSEVAIKLARSIRIPGRYERFAQDSKTILLDGAHNNQKIAALVDSLYDEFGEDSLVAVVSFGKNKIGAVKESIAELSRVARRIILTEFQLDFDDSIRAIDADMLKVVAETGPRIVIEKNPYRALTLAKELAVKEDLDIIVTGSFYLVSNIRNSLLEEY